AIAAFGLALALVFRFRPDTESSAPPEEPAPVAEPVAPAEHVDDEKARASDDEPAQLAPQDAAARAAPAEAHSPLPGEAPATPLTQMLNDLHSNAVAAGTTPALFPIRAEMIEGERAFADEPIDAAWAPPTEAELLAKFAQMQGLKLVELRVECRSTMCRL